MRTAIGMYDRDRGPTQPVRVVDPDFCRECPLHWVKDVVHPTTGSVTHINQCMRRDCDNHIGKTIPNDPIPDFTIPE